jgi:hypothetical protein
MVDISLLPDLTLDREAWSTVFADKHTSLVNDFDAIEHWERKIIDSGSPFGVALAALRERLAGWPFMDSRLDCAAWLDEMLLDDDALAPKPLLCDLKRF